MISLFDVNNLAPSPEEIINKLFPNGWEPIVIQLIATFLMFLIASKFLFKPVRNILKQRADYVENHIKDAEKSSQEAALKNEEAKQNIADSKLKANEIVEEAKNDGLIIKEQVLEEARQEALAMKEKATKEIEQEKQKAREEINREIINVALLASNKVLEREINVEDNKRLVEDFIKDVVN